MSLYYLSPVISIVFLSRLSHAQINLGSFFLHPQQGGGFDLGLSQAANILGFGGDRSFKLLGNANGVGIESGGGALIGGQRAGVDSGFSVANRGIDIGSNLQFGNNPAPAHPLGQLGSFLDNARYFFQSLGGMLGNPQPVGGNSFVPPPTQAPEIAPHSGQATPFPTIRPNPEEESLESQDFEDIIFSQTTETPRQLPGMIELEETTDEEKK